VTFIIDDGPDTTMTMKLVFDGQGKWLVPQSQRIMLARRICNMGKSCDVAGGRLGNTEPFTDYTLLTTLTESQIRTALAIPGCDRGTGLTCDNLVYPNHKFKRAGAENSQGILPDPHAGTYSAVSKSPYAQHVQFVAMPVDTPASLADYKAAVDIAVAEKRWQIFYMHTTDAADDACVSS